MVQLLSLISAVLNCGYCISLILVRHLSLEDFGWIDTTAELLVNSSVVFAYFLFKSKQNKFISIINICVSVLLTLRSYQKYVKGRQPNLINLKGKTYIITGSNTGIGFETAKTIALMGGNVVLACRTLSKAESAKREIITATNCDAKNVNVLELDLSAFSSVRKFVKSFHSMNMPLHCLINNAGLMMSERSITEDGVEMVMAANHFGHFLLTNLLLPDLNKVNGRVVIVSSSLHKLASSFNFDDIMSEKRYSLFGTYAQSKLANILFAFELQRRIWASGSGTTVNVVHPGIVRTDFPRHMTFVMRLANNLVAPVLLLLQKTPAQGAYSSVDVAVSPAWEGVGGKYVFHCITTDTSAAARDTDAAKRLWELSEKITGIALPVTQPQE